MRSGLRSANRMPSERQSAASRPCAKTANAHRCPAKAQAAAPAPNVSNARRFIPEKTGARLPPRFSFVLLRLEDVAVEDRRDTEIRYIDQLRDVEINGHAGQHVSLLAAEPF